MIRFHCFQFPDLFGSQYAANGFALIDMVLDHFIEAVDMRLPQFTQRFIVGSWFANSFAECFHAFHHFLFDTLMRLLVLFQMKTHDFSELLIGKTQCFSLHGNTVGVAGWMPMMLHISLSVSAMTRVTTPSPVPAFSFSLTSLSVPGMA